MGDQTYILGKLGKRKYMQDLVGNGIVYMQRVREFRDHKDIVRGDRDEGSLLRADARAPGTWMHINVGQKRIPLKSASLQIHGPYQDHGIYCMLSISAGEGGPLSDDPRTPLTALHERLPEFGDTLVVLNDTAAFVERLQAAARSAGYGLKHSLVEYVPAHYSGEMGPFRKLGTYSHQAEWRFMTTTPIPDKTLTLELGSLRDIAHLYGLFNAPSATS